MSGVVESSDHDGLVAELYRRLASGDIAVGQLVDAEGERFWVEGFDPVSAEGRRVYVRAERGRRFAVEIPSP